MADTVECLRRNSCWLGKRGSESSSGCRRPFQNFNSRAEERDEAITST